MRIITDTHDYVTLSYREQDRGAAERLLQTCQRVLPMAEGHWDLQPPGDIWLYVMTEDWLRDMWRAVPALMKLPFALTLPFWYLRVRRMWKYVGGWQQQFGRRRVIGVKPPHMILASDRSIGERIYLPEPDLEARIGQLACHELVHACSAHLRLPAWLNEGLAMVAVDHFIDRQSIRPATLEALMRSSGQPGSGSYLRVNVNDQEAAVYLYVRGYWITRYLEETRAEVLKSLLEKRMPHRRLENRLAKSFHMDRSAFWRQIDRLVVDHFK